MVLNYKDFINESLINESFIYYNSDLRDIFLTLKDDTDIKVSEISNMLLRKEYSDLDNLNTGVISIGDKDGYLKYSSERTIINKLNVNVDFDEYKKLLLKYFKSGNLGPKQINNLDNDLLNVSKSEIKLGRFINKIMPDKYSSQDIENFVNKFKSLQSDDNKFKLVEGKEISEWYSSSKIHGGKVGTLGNSCMNDKTEYMRIYGKNPEVCKMLILTKRGKLLGRALVWKVFEINGEKKEEWVMDRVYSVKDHYVDMFHNYADENGWIYKSKDHIKFKYKGEFQELNMYVQLNRDFDYSDYNPYPYIDTFYVYNPNDQILNNFDEKDGFFALRQTNGDYREIGSGKYSNLYDEYIPEEDAVWSRFHDSWIWLDYSVYINEGTYAGDYMDQEHGEWIYDNHIDVYVWTDDAVYSEINDDWIYAPYAIKVLVYIDKFLFNATYDYTYSDNSEVILVDEKIKESDWWKNMTKNDQLSSDTKGFLERLLVKDNDGNWVLKKWKY